MNCSQNCSINCGGRNETCHHLTGVCTSGCAIGFEGEKCESLCRKGTYGQNCTQICNNHCGGPHKECHHITGECTSGCVAGYKGATCKSPVPLTLMDYLHKPFVVFVASMLAVFLLCVIAMVIFVLTDGTDDLGVKSQRDETKLEASQIHSGSDIQGEYDMQDLVEPDKDSQNETRNYDSKYSDWYDRTEPEKQGPEESRSYFTEISDVLKEDGQRQQEIGSHSYLGSDEQEAKEPLETEL
ncbi:multiple epidermal growth factor-like domains 10 [Elysia marginata]|uniref:Multiple epidermal growth factor-like domains 10 n=1 Tax=Elysia marginata TaxID=1093978 RepID=A0AAV4FGZ4_9GAST|nr:multiple epidermal growth factor-like domains 10 [Elysia marginata]